MSRSGAFWFFLLSTPMFAYWLTNGLFLGHIADHLALVYALDAFVLLAWPGVVWKLTPQLVRPTSQDLGLAFLKRDGADILQTTILCFALLAVAVWVLEGLSWAFLWKVDWTTTTGHAFSWRTVIPNGLDGVLARLYLAISAGFVEEIYFRGLLKHVLYRGASRATAKWLFISISAIAFGAIHWEGGLSKLVATTLVGVLEARLFLWLGSLWPLIFAHAALDLLSFLK